MSAELVLEDFLAEVGQRVTDLGVTVAVDHFLADSWSTRLRFRILEAPFPYTICAASLTPAIWGEAADDSVTFPPLDLLRVEPDSHDPSSAWMVFGALPEGTSAVLLVISRLQVPPVPHHPDLYYNAFLDPFDPEEDSERASRLECAGGRRRGHEYELPPQWEATGRWAFHLAPGRRVPASRQVLEASARVGPFTVLVPWLDRGAAGTLIALDFLPPSYEEAWGTDWRWRALQTLDRDGPAWVFPEAPTARLSVALEGESVRGTRSGPFGSLQVRHYLELSPILERVVPCLRVEEIHGLHLPEPIEYRFVPRTYESAARCELSLAPIGVEGTVTFEIVDIHEDESCFVLAYRLQVHSSDVVDVRLVRPWLVDHDGYLNMCQAEGLHELMHAIDWTTINDGRRGFLFPPVDSDREVTLRFEVIDVTLANPLELKLSSPT